ARIIEDKRKMALTVMLTPFMPCSAKLPIIALFGGFFFGGSGFFAASLYFLAVLIIVVSAIILKPLINSGSDPSFIYELPPLRPPDLSCAVKEVFHRLSSFIARVGTVVFVCSVATWALNTFTPTFAVADAADESILSYLGRLLSPVMYPVIGVNSWQATVCALEGLIAKEQVVSSMNVLDASESLTSVFDGATFGFFDRASAYAFVCFNLFSPPCVGAIAAMKKEIGLRLTLLTVAYEFFFSIAFSSSIRLILSLFI
ncbi:MAG: ferrous iron transporter B, partial [Clostridia bacterium]|nr:ferrous iron transporter B [Clostridia bacterium]